MWIVLFALRHQIHDRRVLGDPDPAVRRAFSARRRMSTDILPRVDTPGTPPRLDLPAVLTPQEMAAKITLVRRDRDAQQRRRPASRSAPRRRTAAALVKLQASSPYVDIATALSQVGVGLPDHPAAACRPGEHAAADRPHEPLERPDRPAGCRLRRDDGRPALRLRAAQRCAPQLQSIPGMRISLPYGGRSAPGDGRTRPRCAQSPTASAPSEVNARRSARQNLTLPSGTHPRGRPRAADRAEREPRHDRRLPRPAAAPRPTGPASRCCCATSPSVRDGEAVDDQHRPPRTARTPVIDRHPQARQRRRRSTSSTASSTRLPEIRAAAPGGRAASSRSSTSPLFVRAAVGCRVAHEILLVGGLVALVVLLFLGSWRSNAGRAHLDPARAAHLGRSGLSWASARRST
jgi:hypothetical protein